MLVRCGKGEMGQVERPEVPKKCLFTTQIEDWGAPGLSPGGWGAPSVSTPPPEGPDPLLQQAAEHLG